MEELSSYQNSILNIFGKKYKVGLQIGGGSFGKIYDATDENGKEVVLKFMLFYESQNSVSSLFNEFTCLRELCTNKIVKMLDFAVIPKSTPNSGNCSILVLEKAEMDLNRFLGVHKRDRTVIPKSKIRRIFRTLLEGVHLIHVHSIIHRDLKPSNILVFCKGTKFKMTDFGSCIRMRYFDKKELCTHVGRSARDPRNIFLQGA